MLLFFSAVPAMIYTTSKDIRVANMTKMSKFHVIVKVSIDNTFLHTE